MSNVVSNQGPTGFLDLSSELRNQIYGYALEDFEQEQQKFQPVVPLFQPIPPPGTSENWKANRTSIPSQSSTQPYALPLTQVCTGIRHQFRPLFLKAWTVRIPGHDLDRFMKAFYPNLSTTVSVMAPRELQIVWTNSMYEEEFILDILPLLQMLEKVIPGEVGPEISFIPSNQIDHEHAIYQGQIGNTPFVPDINHISRINSFFATPRQAWTPDILAGKITSVDYEVPGGRPDHDKACKIMVFYNSSEAAEAAQQEEPIRESARLLSLENRELHEGIDYTGEWVTQERRSMGVRYNQMVTHLKVRVGVDEDDGGENDVDGSDGEDIEMEDTEMEDCDMEE